MTPHERLRQAIDWHRSRLREGIPSQRQAAILALLHARDRLPHPRGIETRPDLITGRRLADLGGNLALQLCLESTGDSLRDTPSASLDIWADRFLASCADVAEAELVLGHSETGFMRLVDEGEERLDAWIATKRAPANWVERADFDWWAGWLAGRHESEMGALEAGILQTGGEDPNDGAAHRRLADHYIATMAHQLAYPADAVISGCAVQTCLDVLRCLIARVLTERALGEVVTPRSERSLIADIASTIGEESDTVGDAMAAFTVDRENAAWHAAVPGVAAAPLVRVDVDCMVLSLRGLTTDPLLFLARELRRRDAQEYHNTAWLREVAFRQDLYALFGDKRFIASTDQIKLRREAGSVRTDIDAAIFDRKTGTLALFELKSHDPFARSTGELLRRRDNVLYANRQVSGVLEWLNRHGADALLERVDPRAARTFRVQKVLLFVLGRYLVHFGDGPKPDRRAAWGTWPQVLRLLDRQLAASPGGNPLAALHARLVQDDPLARVSFDDETRQIVLGPVRLAVHSSYAAYQVSAGAEPG